MCATRRPRKEDPLDRIFGDRVGTVHNRRLLLARSFLPSPPLALPPFLSLSLPYTAALKKRCVLTLQRTRSSPLPRICSKSATRPVDGRKRRAPTLSSRKSQRHRWQATEASVRVGPPRREAAPTRAGASSFWLFADRCSTSPCSYRQRRSRHGLFIDPVPVHCQEDILRACSLVATLDFVHCPGSSAIAAALLLLT